jgi:RNA polymerase sigma-70 factor (ECF subfamily)
MSDDLLERMFRTHGRMITAYLHAVLGDWQVAADLTQETFVVAHRKLEHFDRGKSAGAWLRGIARNLARNAVRKQARHREVLLEGKALENTIAYSDPGRRDDGGAWITALCECMEKLPERQKEAVGLFYSERKKAGVVADIMGVKEKSVFQLLWEARKSLRACIEKALGVNHG